MSAALFQKMRSKLAEAQEKASTPIVFLQVNASSTEDIGEGSVDIAGGEDVTVTAFPPGVADADMVSQGVALAGQQVVIVRAEACVRSGGQLFEPQIGGLVRIHGVEQVVEKMQVVRDHEGAAVVFFLALRS